MAGAFGGNHHHVQVGARHDLVVVHVEAVGKGQYGTLFQVGFDFGAVYGRLVFIRQQNHHQIGGFGGIGHAAHVETGSLGFVPGAALAQADNHVYAGIFQVGGVGMALRAVADDGHGFAFDQGEVGVFIVVNLHVDSFFWIWLNGTDGAAGMRCGGLAGLWPLPAGGHSGGG